MENVSTAIVARRESRLLSGNLLSVVLIALALVAPFVLYPVFLMKALCFALFACAFNLLIGYVGLLSFGHAAFFGTAGYLTAHSAKVWGLPPELAILFGTAASSLLGLVFGGLAIRRQGIYFAMVTLALAQMVYFYALQAPFTHGEDGIQAVPRGTLLGMIDLNQPLAVRPSPEGDPRERAARHLARLQDRSVQARRLRPLGRACRSRRRHKIHRLPARLADRRDLADVGRGRADDAARRARHRARPGGRRLHRHCDGELSGAVRLVGDDHSGRHLRGLRPHLPPRRRRRDPAPPAQADGRRFLAGMRS